MQNYDDSWGIRINMHHKSSCFEFIHAGRVAISNLVNIFKELLDKKYKPDGYNIGIDVGEEAGRLFAISVE